MEQSEVELRDVVALAGRILDGLGLVDYLGHVSARVPGTDRVVIKPKHSPRIKSMANLTGEHMIVIDLDGNQLEGGDPPPAEVFIHTEIYRARPDVGSVVHTHQKAATHMGLIDAPILPLLHIPSTYVDVDPPTWGCPLLVTTPHLGRQLTDVLGDNRYCHLQGHGIVSVAGDVPTATVATVMLEELAETNLRILQTGHKPRAITDEELEQLKEFAAPVDGRWAYFAEKVDAR